MPKKALFDFTLISVALNSSDYSKRGEQILKKSLKYLINSLGYDIAKQDLRPQMGSRLQPLNLNLTDSEASVLSKFHNSHYYWMNEVRWRIFLQCGLDLSGKTVFEPGAGIGDQTEWLLNRGVKKVFVSEARETNLNIIRKRFSLDSRVITYQGDLESSLDSPDFLLTADFIFLWGVYYHIFDPIPEFPILKKLSRLAPVIAFDYLESHNNENVLEIYDYDHPTTALSKKSWRQTKSAIIGGVKSAFGYAYFPKEQMDAFDPRAPLWPRRIIVGSKTPLSSPGLIEAL